MRGWFAARADRDLPQPDDLPEKTFIDRGYEAGIASGGRALPLLENPESDAASLAGVDVDAVLEAYRARKVAMQARAEEPIPGVPMPGESASTGADPSPLQEVPAPDGADRPPEAPSIRSPKSRWDDDEEAPAETTATNPGRKRRYGN